MCMRRTTLHFSYNRDVRSIETFAEGVRPSESSWEKEESRDKELWSTRTSPAEDYEKERRVALFLGPLQLKSSFKTEDLDS